jgi:ABC-2 type transport system ATP-binding protein
MSPAVEIRELGKVFQVGFARKRPVVALESLTLDVERGATFGFLGPNGAGKTTTIKLLVRLLRPTSGSARILGEPIDSVDMHARIGFLPEQAYFYDYLTARELLMYFGRLARVDAAILPRRVDEMLERVGLDRNAFDRPLRKFSKGMLQRVGLAQAIVHDPEVVFLDEPMSGLDPIGRRQVRDLILELRAAGKTVFFSSHILPDVEALCDQVAILNAGRLVETGRLADILRDRARGLEVVATDIDDAGVEALRADGFDVTKSPGGVHLRVPSEDEVERAIARLRARGGKLVSVSQTRASLEEFFLREVGGEVTAAGG